MEYYDRKATFALKHAANETHALFVSIDIGGFEYALESRDDFDRLPEREQFNLIDARTTLLERWQALPDDDSLKTNPPISAQVYWAEMGGSKRVALDRAPA
ncbi:MAG: hypothetical protein EB084_09825 [Proteobacteria bacterium]|nr:hypothetical protein [Pseudomonadota bacterium]